MNAFRQDVLSSLCHGLHQSLLTSTLYIFCSANDNIRVWDLGGGGGGGFRNNSFKTGYDMAQWTLMNSSEVNNLQLSHDSEIVLQPVSDPSTCKSHGPTCSSRQHALR